MSFDKIDGIMHFSEYKSFFKFINNWDGDLTVKRYEVFDGTIKNKSEFKKLLIQLNIINE